MRVVKIIQEIETFLQFLRKTDPSAQEFERSIKLMELGVSKLKAEDFHAALNIFTDAISLAEKDHFLLQKFHKIRALAFLMNHQISEAVEDFTLSRA